jgi:hypothetical protein
MTPPARERAAFKKNRRADTRPVMNGKFTNIKDQALDHLPVIPTHINKMDSYAGYYILDSHWLKTA